MKCLPRVAAAILAHATAAAAGPPPTPVATTDTSPPRLQRTTEELVQLHVTSAGYGVLTGVWIHALSGGDSPWSFALPAVGVAALGMGTTAWLDHRQRLTLGLPQAIVTDTFIGAEIAAAWVWHFRAANAPDADWSPQAEASVLWGGATLGAGLGVLRYAFSPSAPGQAAFTGSVTLWSGVLSGLLAGALSSDPITRDDHASRATAFGLELGVIAGSFLGRRLKPSIGWVHALDAGALLGGGAFMGTYLLATGNSFDDRAVFAVGAAGVGAGLVAAALLAPRLGWPRTLAFSVAPQFTPSTGAAGMTLHAVF